MQKADPESYQAVINALSNYEKQVKQSCIVMKRAGDDCVANTDGDVAALRSNEKLGLCIQKIDQSLETVNELIRALQEELERIIETARKAENI